ncbi:hypothetical protein O988_03400 [Pseudogymnoascus sp. VKM F-3808]|nr:hypothetical protein O988_03400 [Pseudogymnoascus sp. VKM F-3808]
MGICLAAVISLQNFRGEESYSRCHFDPVDTWAIWGVVTGMYQQGSFARAGTQKVAAPTKMISRRLSNFCSQSSRFFISLSKIDEDPDDLLEKTCGSFDEVQRMMEIENLSQARAAAYEEYIIDTMAAMIFGSNMIEKAGSTEDISMKLCKVIFAGFTVPPEIPSNHPDYTATGAHLLHQNLDASHESITRSRLEITQHAGAWTYLLSSPLTESHLLTTHRILCTSLDLDDHTPYAGLYRFVPVHAGLTAFPPPSSVPHLMRMLVYDYNLAIQRARTAGFLDPFALAAEFAHRSPAAT